MSNQKENFCQVYVKRMLTFGEHSKFITPNNFGNHDEINQRQFYENLVYGTFFHSYGFS